VDLGGLYRLADSLRKQAVPGGTQAAGADAAQGPYDGEDLYEAAYPDGAGPDTAAEAAEAPEAPEVPEVPEAAQEGPAGTAADGDRDL
jgi:hypothetical protein